MEHILIIQNINLLAQLKNKSIVVETNTIEMIEQIKNAVQTNNSLFCIKLNINRAITSIPLKEEWQEIPLVIYPQSLGLVRDLVALLPVLKKLNVKFFLDGAIERNYEAVQILSSFGIYSGMVITKYAYWEKLTDLMYYAICSKIAHAPIEPFQYVYDMYERNTLVDYGTVYFNNPTKFLYIGNDGRVAFSKQHLEGRKFFLNNVNEINELEDNKDYLQYIKSWQKFFYEPTQCAACAAWRICLGKYADLEDKIGCQNFTTDLFNIIDNNKFKK